MSSYFDACNSELSDILKRSGEDFQALYDFDQKLVTDIGIDVELNHADPALRFPEHLKGLVYKLFWKYSFVVNPNQDETEVCSQYQMMRRLVSDLHDVYHERAYLGHPLGDSVSLGLSFIVSDFKDNAKAARTAPDNVTHTPSGQSRP